jgi:hypothetical protein
MKKYKSFDIKKEELGNFLEKASDLQIDIRGFSGRPDETFKILVFIDESDLEIVNRFLSEMRNAIVQRRNIS